MPNSTTRLVVHVAIAFALAGLALVARAHGPEALHRERPTTAASGTEPTHAFTTPGPHRVTVTVSDGLEDVDHELGVIVGEPMTAPTLKAKLNFKRASKDAFVFETQLDLPDDFVVPGAVVDVHVGDVPRRFAFDKQGLARTGSGKATLKYKQKTGLWTLTVSLKKGDRSDVWRNSGLVDTTVKKVPVTMKCTVTIGDWRCAHLVDALYSAKAGKWGRTK